MNELERRKHKLATIYLWQGDDGTFGATWDWGGTWDWSTSGEALQRVTDALSGVRHVDLPEREAGR